MSRIILILALSISALACRDLIGPELSDDIVEKEWDLQGFEQPDGSMRDVGSVRITLILSADDTLRGKTYTTEEGFEFWRGFNYRTTYYLGENGTISAGTPAWDEYVPSAPSPNRWEEFVRAIKLAESYRLNGSEFTILYDDNWKLVFREYIAPVEEETD